MFERLKATAFSLLRRRVVIAILLISAVLVMAYGYLAVLQPARQATPAGQPPACLIQIPLGQPLRDCTAHDLWVRVSAAPVEPQGRVAGEDELSVGVVAVLGPYLDDDNIAGNVGPIAAALPTADIDERTCVRDLLLMEVAKNADNAALIRAVNGSFSAASQALRAAGPAGRLARAQLDGGGSILEAGVRAVGLGRAQALTAELIGCQAT